MQIICEKCNAEIHPQQETIRDGEIEHTFFRCPECGALYPVCATDEALRENIASYRDQGASIYHGSNTIYRKYCSEKGKLSSVSQLKPGMAWQSLLKLQKP